MVFMKVKQLHREAVVPKYAHGALEDAGMDLYSAEAVTLTPGAPLAVKTGIAIELPPYTEGQIRSRSGMAAKFGVFVLNSPGTIDPSYRGEVKVLLMNLGPAPYHINIGDRIAQLVVAAYTPVSVCEVAELSDTERGSRGFGSTGK